MIYVDHLTVVISQFFQIVDSETSLLINTGHNHNVSNILRHRRQTNIKIKIKKVKNVHNCFIKDEN